MTGDESLNRHYLISQNVSSLSSGVLQECGGERNIMPSVSLFRNSCRLINLQPDIFTTSKLASSQLLRAH